MTKTASKIIMPKHVWDGKSVEKKKNELEKVPTPTGFRIVLFPLKLEGKTKGGIHLTDETIQESQITTNICKVLKVGPSAYKDEIRIVNDDEIIGTVDDPRDILPANIL